MGKLIDLTGKRFGRLTVISFVELHKKNRSSVWQCKCDCGVEKNITSIRLLHTRTLSCGCLRASQNPTLRLIHGETKKTKEYRAWRNMKARCLNPQEQDRKLYKDRGITVCERWMHSFPNFLQDMGRAPSPKHSIDRINNDGNYEPSNCRWATAVEQANNKRNNKKRMICQ